MRAATAIVGVLAASGLALAASHSPRTLAMLGLLVALVQVAARGASRFVLGYPSLRGGAHPPARVRLAIVALAMATPAVWMAVRGGSTIVHTLALTVAGVALARWVRSSERAPVHLASAIGVLAFVAAVSSGSAARGATRWLVFLPLDASVAWAAWHVAAIRGPHVPFSGLRNLLKR